MINTGNPHASARHHKDQWQVSQNLKPGGTTAFTQLAAFSSGQTLGILWANALAETKNPAWRGVFESAAIDLPMQLIVKL